MHTSATRSAATPAPSRRGFLKGAGLVFSLSAGWLGEMPAAQAAGRAGRAIGYWVEIAADGAIRIAVPAAEMGQGALTALAMIVAEELDADWSRVSVDNVARRPDIFGNPAYGGAMMTAGSRSVSGYWTKIRLQGGAVRRVLMSAAADAWSVPLSELTTEPSLVLHAATGRRLRYGEIAAFATVPETLPVLTPADLKPATAYRIIGRPVPRLDLPGKVDGSAVFGVDVRVPGMLYGTLLRSPAEGAAPLDIDRSGVSTAGGVRIVPLRDAVGIVADTLEAAFAARDALRVRWAKVPYDGFGSEAALRDFVARAENGEDRGLTFVQEGEADAAFAGAAKVVSATYTTDYVYHAQLEPINVTASVSPAGDGAEIWIGTQNPGNVVAAAAAVLDVKPDRIKVNQHLLGGGFGRRIGADMVPYAVLMAKAAGRPVKTVWSREQDVKAAKMRPMTAHRLEAGLDAGGGVAAWRHRIVAESIFAYPFVQRLEQVKGLDPLVLEGSEIPYEVPHQRVSYHREIRGTPLSAWRGIGAGHNKFAIESFVDEVAAAKGVDPVAFRLGLLRDNPRAARIVKAAAEMAGWDAPREPGRTLGFAFGKIVGSWTAAALDVSLDRTTGMIRVHRAWVAIDPGIAVNPDSIVAQSEGNIVFGLSQALKERATVKDGVVEQSNFFDYRVARMSDTPEIEVRILPGGGPPSGVGEAALPLMAPCIANAVFALTGVRFRNLPLTPARVKAGLNAGQA